MYLAWGVEPGDSRPGLLYLFTFLSGLLYRRGGGTIPGLMQVPGGKGMPLVSKMSVYVGRLAFRIHIESASGPGDFFFFFAISKGGAGWPPNLTEERGGLGERGRSVRFGGFA